MLKNLLDTFLVVGGEKRNSIQQGESISSSDNQVRNLKKCVLVVRCSLRHKLLPSSKNQKLFFLLVQFHKMTSIPHAIMFHHFCGGKHHKGQGAISSSDFQNMLDWLERKHTIINAVDYQNKFSNNSLGQNDICLSFDDGLLSQYEIAHPILKDRGLTAFYFIYSSPYFNEPNYLEIFRYFRTATYQNIDLFYKEFFNAVETDYSLEFNRSVDGYNPKLFLKEFPFYSESDRFFRYLRDVTLGLQNYQTIMLNLMDARGFKSEEIVKYLWMSESNISELENCGNIIGLHSHSHPTQIHRLDFRQQKIEYQKNFDHLSKITKREITSMSHPCGNYNDCTLDLLTDLGITIGFRSNISLIKNRHELELSREDHSNILREMRK